MNSVLQTRSVRRFWQSTSGRIGLFLTVALLAIALLAPILRPDALAIAPNFIARLQPPSLTHSLGTDGLGRDFLTLIWYGIRTSLLISLISVGVGATIGLILGLVAGYFRGLLDLVISWIADILLAF
ncbi:MAG TPA: ABC transporter permease, partial [Leptolyngbya sp.]|nr:ABC transporter permease [Leptolyngbya sp.]